MALHIGLNGKVAVVTGAGSGIGRACALALASAGAAVVLAGRREAALAETATAIAALPDAPATLVQVCDVADPQAVRDLFQTVFKQFKRLDVLVANAGVMDDALIGMVTPDLIERVFATNTHGLLYCSQYASRLMARSGGGSIVALGSIVGQQGFAGQSVYAGAKAAVVGVARSLAKELAAQQIRVNVVAPGFIETALTAALPPERRSAAVSSVALGRAGLPEDVADAVLFLASDMSRYVTGQVLGIDGGMRL
ncbi:SDR family NAD(P)-dependent oxidoreductase [Roseateles cellulosilyticus]|uniref:Glucose 1-dehydrogenase n=1 Tax=Pelomonas cellulosilytica TaxID=2906762 RepID=A0ABS8XW14_9BURK|nr:glucose 1-dehydrogenase [Pelomonas sp. P8]MCE4556118.1 glucose 1-dehydrogenase [Pelomonas sp. P8]